MTNLILTFFKLEPNMTKTTRFNSYTTIAIFPSLLDRLIRDLYTQQKGPLLFTTACADRPETLLQTLLCRLPAKSILPQTDTSDKISSQIATTQQEKRRTLTLARSEAPWRSVLQIMQHIPGLNSAGLRALSVNHSMFGFIFHYIYYNTPGSLLKTNSRFILNLCWAL